MNDRIHGYVLKSRLKNCDEGNKLPTLSAICGESTIFSCFLHKSGKLITQFLLTSAYAHNYRGTIKIRDAR